MRLLKFNSRGRLSLTKNLHDNLPSYAILSHTWGNDDDEVTFDDLKKGVGKRKAGYAKIRFCGKQAEKDGLTYFWVDTCCIDKTNNTELSEAITSMFDWYRDAAKCYVYLLDVVVGSDDTNQSCCTWESAFRESRWFTRGWTLQELLAPASVEFFSREEISLGDKKKLNQQIHEITGLPIAALDGSPVTEFSIDDRLKWAAKRNTKRKEDKAYCLFGIFNVFLPLIYGEGDNAFVRLKEEIDKNFKGKATANAGPSISPPTDVHWLVSRPPNPLFTGREDLLQELEKFIRDALNNPPNHQQCRVVISGMGGQGKSEISLQLAHRLRSIFWAVFWVDVSTTNLAETSLVNIAKRLSLPAETWQDACLGIANLKHPWLLVLDNADDPDIDYQNYFPSGTLGSVILTSRNYECQQYALKSVSLERLSDNEATELLFRVAKLPHVQHQTLKDEAQAVATLLGSHPLALIQAGSYISRGHCSLAEYPQLFKQQRKRLLVFRPTQARSRYQDVYATFEASAEALRRSNTESAQDALQLLPILATCAPNRFPLQLFEVAWNRAQTISPNLDVKSDLWTLIPWHVSHLPPFVQVNTNTWDPFRLREAIYLLKSFSLVSTDTHDGHVSVSMHPLTHAWARDRQEAKEQHDSWVSTACVMGLSRVDEEFWRQHGRQLQPHLHALTSWEIGEMFTGEPARQITGILVNCGWLLQGLRDDSKLFNLMNALLVHLGLEQSVVDRMWLSVYNLNALNLRDCGKVTHAVSVLEQIVNINGQGSPEGNRDLLISQHNLSQAYLENSQITEAISLLQHVVKIREQTLAEDHPRLLTSQHVLAQAYLANSQITEAISLLQHVVKIEEQTLAENHLDLLTSQHVLARAYLANSQITEAISLLQHVVKIREQTLAENHPHLLMSQYVLALAYQGNGQLSEAIGLFEHVVAMDAKVLKADDPDRQATLQALARAYEENVQTSKAVSLLENVVDGEPEVVPQKTLAKSCGEPEFAKGTHSRRKRPRLRR